MNAGMGELKRTHIRSISRNHCISQEALVGIGIAQCYGETNPMLKPLTSPKEHDREKIQSLPLSAKHSSCRMRTTCCTDYSQARSRIILSRLHALEFPFNFTLG
jgi:hypothetical protein